MIFIIIIGDGSHISYGYCYTIMIWRLKSNWIE